MGVLDEFDSGAESEVAKYDSLLSTKMVDPNGQVAAILGLGVADLQDGRKPYVLLSGMFGEMGKRKTQRVALVLKRKNGSALARYLRANKLSGEAELKGVTVKLELSKVAFRGKEVDTIDLSIPPQSHP